MNSEKLSKPFDNSELIRIESALSAHLTRRKIRQEAATDLETFAREFLRIRTKSGATTPLLFNGAQRELHRRIEEQRAKTGRVRVIALKARQLGVSTYVAARLYHRTIHSPGQRTIIIAHERRASSNLFELVKRFHEHVPDDIRPSTKTSNAEELVFDKIELRLHR